MYTGRDRAVVLLLSLGDAAPGGGCMPRAGAQGQLRIAPSPDDAGSQDRDAPDDAADQRRDNLPVEISSFIGREAAIAEVTGLFERQRLVTLTGAPGVGKTQLALRAAAGLRDRFADGVWLVELAALTEPDLVLATVASTLGLRTEDGRPTAEALAERLGARQTLLLLDNCEHLADACSGLIAALLRACPELRVLATSREPLGVAGEICWPVPPLTVPGTLALATVSPNASNAASNRRVLESPHGSQPAWIDTVLASEAGRLFVERARAVRPSLTLTDESAGAIARICQQLDGIPLAIELAAARASALSPAEIAARLDDRFGLLTRNGRTAVPRQRTLRESIDWSHDLLSEPERVLLRRLSIFRGGWTLDGVIGVGCWGIGEGDASSNPPSPVTRAPSPRTYHPSPRTCHPSPNTLDVLTSLVEKSLVVAEERGGETHYHLLETLREYAAERLREAGEAAALAQRHWDWCVDLAEQAALHLRGTEQARWRARLESEHDNLRAALARALARDEAEPGLRICVALWVFWFERGYDGEGSTWTSRMLALPSASARTPLRAAALFVAGKLATEGADLTLALAHCQESLAIAREHDDAHTIHRALTQLGHIERGRGRWLAARRYYEEALPLRRALGDPVTVAISLTCLGRVAHALHEYEAARALYEESLELYKQQEHPSEIIATQQHLGLLAHAQGDDAEAAAWFAEALPVACRISNPRRIAALLEGFATLAVRHQPERAIRLAGAAAALREASGTRLTPSGQDALRQELALARRLLDDEAISAAWAAGTRLTVDQAVSLALTPPTDVHPAQRPDPASRLTAREREVAALVARGLTNRQIAETLVVSQRTAESHVANSLSKLGLATRAQLAAWATGRGLVAPADVSPT
jgi:non-specific serine/threonine protein kinase